MSKLSKVERLRELARNRQAKIVAGQRQEADKTAAALQGISDLVGEYRNKGSEVDDIEGIRLHRRFFGELYNTYVAQGERLAAQERLLSYEVGELNLRHKHLSLLRSVLKKREEVHKYAARKKAAKAQIHRGMSKL